MKIGSCKINGWKNKFYFPADKKLQLESYFQNTLDAESESLTEHLYFTNKNIQAPIDGTVTK